MKSYIKSTNSRDKKERKYYTFKDLPLRKS